MLHGTDNIRWNIPIFNMNEQKQSKSLEFLLIGRLHHGPWSRLKALWKYVIGNWTCLGTTSVYIQGKKSKWPWSSRSRKYLFWGLHYPLTWPNKFCGGRGKRGALVKKGKGPWPTNVVIINCCCIFLRGKRRRRQENGQTCFFSFQNCPFWAYIKINQHNHFLMHGRSSWSTLGLHIVRGPKDV